MNLSDAKREYEQIDWRQADNRDAAAWVAEFVDAILARVRALESALRAIEWSGRKHYGDTECCPLCKATEGDEHESTCIMRTIRKNQQPAASSVAAKPPGRVEAEASADHERREQAINAAARRVAESTVAWSDAEKSLDTDLSDETKRRWRDAIDRLARESDVYRAAVAGKESKP